MRLVPPPVIIQPYDPAWPADQLAFRDRLRQDDAARHAYSLLKVELASKYRNDREAYTEAKTGFVQTILSPR